MEADHQTCLAHLARRCAELGDSSWDRGRETPNRVADLLRDALSLRDRRDAHERAPVTVQRRLLALQHLLDALLARPAIRHPGNRRLLQHQDTERDTLFTFLRVPGIPATNWRAEQAVRPAVVNRKTWGGNCTWPGAGVQEVLMTVLRISRRRHRDGVSLLAAALRTPSRANPALLTP
jgi:transposase